MNITVVFDRRKTGKKGSFELFIYVSKQDHMYRATKVSIDRQFYDPKTNRVSFKHPKAAALNIEINTQIRKIEDYELYCLRMQLPLSCQAITQQLLKPKSYSLNLYMREQLELDKPSLAPSRYKQVRSMLNNFDKFGNHTFLSFDADMLRKFHNHLLLTMQETTTNKNHKVIKKYISRAHGDGLIQRNVYTNFKITPANVKRIYLTSDELKLLREYKGHQRIERVRDLFLFMCLSGIAFSDMTQLTPANMIKLDDRFFIVKKRQKTNVEQMVPLFDEAKALIDKYRTNERLFPAISNQKMNVYLKELADVCGIVKEITSHTSRHTFATLLLTAGMPLESVSRMLGHSALKTTQLYAELLSRKLANDFDRLKIEGI